MYDSIKERLDLGLYEWGLLALVLFVAAASFGLGRLSAFESDMPPVSIKSTPVSASPRSLSLGGLIVASRSGSVYYYPWCSGAQKIAEKNRRWFESEREAIAAGYAASKSCKGLAGQ
jgi:hypothetical protein